MHKWTRVALATLTAGLLLGGATRALGGEEQNVVTGQGRCSVATRWTLTMAAETGISMEIQILSKVLDDPWHVKLYYNGHLEISVSEMTEDPDGAFEIRRVENNAAKTYDTLSLEALNLNTGETCFGLIQADV